MYVSRVRCLISCQTHHVTYRKLTALLMKTSVTMKKLGFSTKNIITKRSTNTKYRLSPSSVGRTVKSSTRWPLLATSVALLFYVCICMNGKTLTDSSVDAAVRPVWRRSRRDRGTRAHYQRRKSIFAGHKRNVYYIFLWAVYRRNYSSHSVTRQS